MGKIQIMFDSLLSSIFALFSLVQTQKLLFLMLGWLLGMLSPIIVSRIYRRYKKRDLFGGLKNELVEVRYTLTCSGYMLCQKFGKFDKDYLRQILPIFESYKGNDLEENRLKDIIKKIIALPDTEIDAFVSSDRQKKGFGLGLKKVSITFTDMNLFELSVFNIEFQSLLFELRSRINILNEEIGNADRLYVMTFDSSIITDNHKRIVEELEKKYLFIQKLTDRVITKINEIINSNKY